MASEATKIPFVEGSAPSTPAASRVVIYAKSDGLMYSKDDAGAETLMSAGSSGSVATDAIWDAAGDLAVGTGANTAAKLTVGASGKVPTSNGTTLAYAYPPGYELDYVEFTGNVTVSAGSEGATTLVATSSSVTYDGSAVWVEMYAAYVQVAAADNVVMVLWDDTASASLGKLAQFTNADGTNVMRASCYVKRKITPAAGARVLKWTAFRITNNGVIGAAAGGTGNLMPGFLRVTKA